MALLRGASGCGAEAQRSACGGGDGGGLAGGKTWYHLVMTNIALENPLEMEVLMILMNVYPLVNQHSY